MDAELWFDALALIGAGTCLYWGVRGLVAFLGWVQRSEIERQAREDGAPRRSAGPPVARPRAGADAIAPEYVAAIAGAVAALGGHRVVFIQDSGSGQTWTHEGRWLHQTSHRTR